MTKLLKLLNQYEKKVLKTKFYKREKSCGGKNKLFRRDTRDEDGRHIYSGEAEVFVISSGYGFIEWLVKNNKLVVERLDVPGFTALEKYYKDYERVIMWLSISYMPIDDLIDLLK